MREIRARIAERKGVDLSNQQILDLAARRLEAVLAPQGLDPALMEELRRRAGGDAARPPQPEPVEPFDESSLYESSNGLVRALRKLFRPLLSLLIDPTALAGALRAQAELAARQAAREAEQRRRQSEWNALHYEILRRVVTDAARAEIDLRDLLQRVESLAARVDFAARRVGALEQAQHQARPARGTETPAATTDGGEQAARPDAESGDGTRRRRRRRRGRRTGGGFPADGAASEGTEAAGADDGSDADEAADGTEAPAAVAAAAPEAPPVSQGWVPPSRSAPALVPPSMSGMPETSPAEAAPAGPAAVPASESPASEPPAPETPAPESPERAPVPAPGTGADPSSTDH